MRFYWRTIKISALIVFCLTKLAKQLKPSNLIRHFESRHKEYFRKYHERFENKRKKAGPK
jgi:hypothetical protein